MVLMLVQVQQAVADMLRHCNGSDAAALPHITRLFHMALQVLPLWTLLHGPCGCHELAACTESLCHACASALSSSLLSSALLPHRPG